MIIIIIVANILLTVIKARTNERDTTSVHDGRRTAQISLLKIRIGNSPLKLIFFFF